MKEYNVTMRVKAESMAAIDFWLSGLELQDYIQDFSWVVDDEVEPGTEIFTED